MGRKEFDFGIVISAMFARGFLLPDPCCCPYTPLTQHSIPLNVQHQLRHELQHMTTSAKERAIQAGEPGRDLIGYDSSWRSIGQPFVHGDRFIDTLRHPLGDCPPISDLS